MKSAVSFLKAGALAGILLSASPVMPAFASEILVGPGNPVQPGSVSGTELSSSEAESAYGSDLSSGGDSSNGGIQMLGSASTLTEEDVADELTWIQTNLQGVFYPYVLEHAVGNPNVIHFLYEYGHDASSPDTFEYTDDELDADVPLLMQWDWRWGYLKYGGTSPAGLTSCAPTCMTMVGLALTKDRSITQPKMCRYSEENGYWVTGQGTMSTLVEDMNMFEGHRVVCTGLSVDESSIRSALSAGCPVVINVGVGRFSAVGHFMVLAGINDDGTFHLNDPNNLDNCRRGWSWSDLGPEIMKAWSYSLAE